MSTLYRNKKGNFVSKKRYYKNISTAQIGKNNKKIDSINEASKFDENQCIIEGLRIIDVGYVANQLHCLICESVLSLSDIAKESSRGLASIFSIRCRNCLTVKKVYSGKTHNNTIGETLYDINSKVALGILHAGVGHTSMDKFFKTINHPFMTSKTFKKYENEVGPIIETIAKDSCLKAAKLERELTIENISMLQNLLPEDLKSNFLTVPNQNLSQVQPTLESNIRCEIIEDSTSFYSNANIFVEETDDTTIKKEVNDATSQISGQNIKDSNVNEQKTELEDDVSIDVYQNSNLQETLKVLADDELMEKKIFTQVLCTYETNEKKHYNIVTGNVDSDNKENILFNDTNTACKVTHDLLASKNSDIYAFMVRLFLTFDMGWSKRGNGRQYDSLNGYLGMFGMLSGKVLDFVTRNRKCRLCDTGRPKTNHDCRLNFFGSAKAMEADAAAELATGSTILTEINAQIGAYIGDNDSTGIHAVRSKSDHPVVKHADQNHTSKGIKSMLYKIDKSKDPDKEMSADAITYLHRCFNYAMAQHKGNTKNMALAISNIPYHAFNLHDNCGQWCSFKKDPKNYQHKTIPGGFKNVILFEELKIFFSNIAKNAASFSAGASSQANESLNSIMSRKAPKAFCYSTGPSADYRFACAVGQKNEGENYVQQAMEKLDLSTGHYLNNHIENTNKLSELRVKKQKTIEFKSKRRFLRNSRTQLKNRKEQVEGVTYETNVSLMAKEKDFVLDNSLLKDKMLQNPFIAEDRCVIFFDIETSGFEINCDILQIALKSDSAVFNKYINPTRCINRKATEINGLSNVEGELFLHGKKVQSFQLRIVLGDVLEYLKQFKKPCILVAHNCSFDATRLLRKIKECGLECEFQNVIAGFVDSLRLFRDKFPEKRKKNELKLTSLASEIVRLPACGAHDAIYDVILLEQLVYYSFEYDCIISKVTSFNEFMALPDKLQERNNNLKDLERLGPAISSGMKRKLAEAGISYEELSKKFKSCKDDLVNMLQQKYNSKSKLINRKSIIDNIIQHFENSIDSM